MVLRKCLKVNHGRRLLSLDRRGNDLCVFVRRCPVMYRCVVSRSIVSRNCVLRLSGVLFVLRR